MDPVAPTTHVWHPYFGALVVVAADALPLSMMIHAKNMEKMKGEGTWAITLTAHNRALKAMDEGGNAGAGPDDMRWVPWSELKRKEQHD